MSNLTHPGRSDVVTLVMAVNSMLKLRRRYLAALSCGLAVAGAPGAPQASELHAHATLTSQYIWRGLSYSDGHAALQAGADYALDSGLFAGAWASTVDLVAPQSERRIELDLYAGYRWITDKPLSGGITFLRYTYPGSEGDHTYDYNEVLVFADWQDRLSLELGYTGNVLNSGRQGRHWTLRSTWPLADAWLIGAGLGGNDLSDLGIRHYLFWDLGVSARLSRFTLDLRWYDNQRPERAPFSNLSADSQIVLSASVGF